MRYGFPSYKNLSLFVLFVSDKIISVLSAIPKFSIIDSVFVNYSSNPVSVTFNKTRISPYTPSNCHVVQGNFSIGPGGNYLPYSNQSLDIFTWNANQLIATFYTAIDWTKMTTYCVLTSAYELINQTFFCNSNDTNLAVYYAPLFPLRSSTTGFLMGNGTTVLCNVNGNGFIVAGYQEADVPPNPIPAVIAATAGFNLLWLIPIAGGALLLTGAYIKRKEIKAGLSHCYRRLWGGDEGQRLIEMDDRSSHQHQSRYGSA